VDIKHSFITPFSSRFFLLFSSSGRKKPKEETLAKEEGRRETKAEGLTYGKKKGNKRRNCFTSF
jgi:hypothetical protein